MDWIIDLIKEHLKEDADVEKLKANISKEFPKHAVPKSEFNDKSNALNEAQKTIDELKESTKGDEELQGKIKAYEDEITNLKAQSELDKKEFILKSELSKKGVTDVDYIIYKQGGLEKFTFNKDGELIGLDDILKTFKESSPFLFEQGSKYSYKPQGGNGGVVTNPFAKETFNLTEQGKLLNTDPARAKELANLAGVEI